LEIRPTRAGASFEGPLETAYRACLWSRLANRVLLPLAEFPAPDERKLYGGVKSIRWSDHVDPGRTIAVDFASSRSKLAHTHFGALKTKDAIVDQLRSVRGFRPDVNPERPDIRVNVHVQEDQATVSLDLSGESLHRRGYREACEQTSAPLKENLAAAILLSAGWSGDPSSGQGGAFLDPMCGSGTLPIEAAMISADRAPGLLRAHFGFLGWPGHVPALWKRLLEEARGREIREKRRLPRIVGTDRDSRAVAGALAAVERAGLTGRVHIEKKEFSESRPPAERGLVVLNPPYGERLGEEKELEALYQQIGDVFKQRFKGWEGAVFTGNPNLAKKIGLKASRRIVLFNGAIECRLLRYELF
jgi:23S rRNA (guanine2445-N2)-methyltransferase / 23S rRNA (guanine2069-N7)-methyltransferase